MKCLAKTEPVEKNNRRAVGQLSLAVLKASHTKGDAFNILRKLFIAIDNGGKDF